MEAALLPGAPEGSLTPLRLTSSLAALLFAAAARPALAADKWDNSFFLSYLFPGTQDFDRIGNSLCAEALADGYATCESAGAGFSSLGIRIAATRPWKGWTVGPSLGINGSGPTAGKASIRTSGPPGTMEFKRNNTTVRLLGDAGKRFDLKGDWRLSLGGGIGVAMVHESVSCTAGGGLAGPPDSCAGVNGSSDTGWFSWELTPSLLHRTWEFGLRYAGFARGGNRLWHTFGFTLGRHY